MNPEDIDGMFRASIEDLAGPVPNIPWDAALTFDKIQGRMAQKPVRKSFWGQGLLAAACVSVLLAAGGTWWLGQTVYSPVEAHAFSSARLVAGPPPMPSVYREDPAIFRDHLFVSDHEWPKINPRAVALAAGTLAPHGEPAPAFNGMAAFGRESQAFATYASPFDGLSLNLGKVHLAVFEDQDRNAFLLWRFPFCEFPFEANSGQNGQPARNKSHHFEVGTPLGAGVMANKLTVSAGLRASVAATNSRGRETSVGAGLDFSPTMGTAENGSLQVSPNVFVEAAAGIFQKLPNGDKTGVGISAGILANPRHSQEFEGATLRVGLQKRFKNNITVSPEITFTQNFQKAFPGIRIVRG